MTIYYDEIAAFTETDFIHVQLTKAVCPEDVFTAGDATELKREFRRMAKIVHPDHVGGSDKVFRMLVSVYGAAEERMRASTWGKRIPFDTHKYVKIGAYDVMAKPVVGDIADIFIGKDVVVKVVRHADDNDLMRAERAAVADIHPPSPLHEGIPALIDTFTVGDGMKKREASVFTRATGFYTAEQVHARLPQVDARTLVWMGKRLFVLLEHVHKAGYIHGGILPPHVLFYPDNDGHTDIDSRKHSLRLIGWGGAVPYKARTRLSTWVPRYASMYPPEIAHKRSLGVSSDLYMAAQLLLYLAGGVALPSGLAGVLKLLTQDSEAARIQTAEVTFSRWKEAATQAFGAPMWHNFNLPKIN